MKTLTKLIMLLAVLAICMPAQGAVLVYKQTLQCWDANEAEIGWDVEDTRVRGYLVLEVIYDKDGSIASIPNATLIEYDRREKLFWEINHTFNVVRVVNGDKIEWVLVESITDKAQADLTMLRGIARDTRIGVDDSNEAARLLKGHLLSYWTNESQSLQMSQYKLRLYSSLTRLYNKEGLDFDAAVYRTVGALLWKGYEEEP